MNAYHVMLVHFPLALWTTAALVILIRVFSDGPFARAADKVLTPLLVLGGVTGILACAVGLFVWPFTALSASPLGRNHMLLGTWTVAYWWLLAITRARLGKAAWAGFNRWLMLGLAGLGAGLLTVTGTLGGHLTGSATAVSQLLRLLGWEVYTTFYLPNFMLALLVLASAAMVAAAAAATRSRRAPQHHAATVDDFR